MKTVRIIMIIVFVASILAGCGQNGMKEYEQQATSKPNPARVPTPEVTLEVTPEVTPDVPEGEGFAYKDEFLGFVTIIEGEGWEVETHYEHRLVVFYNEHVNEYGNNAIYIISAPKNGPEEQQLDEIWSGFVEVYSPKNITSKEIEVGYGLTQTPMKGVEYTFEGKSGEDIMMNVIVVTGENFLYVISNRYNEEGEEVNKKAYDIIKESFVQHDDLFS